MNIKLYNIEKKLLSLEERAESASPAMKTWLRSGYKLLLEEKRRLIKSAEKKENQDSLI